MDHQDIYHAALHKIFYSQIDQFAKWLVVGLFIVVCIAILCKMLGKRIPLKLYLIGIGLAALLFWLSTLEPEIRRIEPTYTTPTPTESRDSPSWPTRRNPPIPQPVRASTPEPEPGEDASPTPIIPPKPTPKKTQEVIVQPWPTLTPWIPSPTPTVTPPTPTPTPRQSSQVYARPTERPRFEAVRVEKLDRGVKVRLFDTRKEWWLDDELHTLGSEPRVGAIIEVAEVQAVYVGAKDISGGVVPSR